MTIVVSTALEGEIDSWDALKSYIVEETDGRADAPQLAAYIRRAENRIGRALAINPVRPMETSVSLSVASSLVECPNDMIRPFALELTDGGNAQEIDYLAPENLSAQQIRNLERANTYVATDGSGSYPHYFTLIDRQIRLWPAPSTPRTGTLWYYRTLPPLSADNQTNWLLRDHGDVYLDGALYYAYRAMPDIEKASLMKGIFEEDMAELVAAYPKPANRATLSVDPMLSARRFDGSYGYPS